ncbi:MAG: hypothetical protein U1F68_06705 [Gammaproteobacteria bacterium]
MSSEGREQAKPENDSHRIKLSELAQDLDTAPAGAATKTSESILDLRSEFSSFRVLPTWMEWFGARLARRVLIFICLMVVLFVIIWWATLPSFDAIAKALGPSPDPAKLTETFNKVRETHTKWVGDFFQLVVVTTLVPLFTLLAGYVFGSQQRKNSGQDDNG